MPPLVDWVSSDEEGGVDEEGERRRAPLPPRSPTMPPLVPLDPSRSPSMPPLVPADTVGSPNMPPLMPIDDDDDEEDWTDEDYGYDDYSDEEEDEEYEEQTDEDEFLRDPDVRRAFFMSNIQEEFVEDLDEDDTEELLDLYEDAYWESIAV